ncbi:hypothetical protein PDO_1091 [Rhizobium sp. PDO1-076]|uniref:DUF6456 domain-containing protein n=2 Tax=Rhizobium TaxID=379 RepID=UPI00024E3570|nr:DUF6456 domain-containing protein [Rhizobium sp. PDO1-076]EHS53381.1 hypothetical protein PDO_1091 [Rhizobium sp. PDO1-076]
MTKTRPSAPDVTRDIGRNTGRNTDLSAGLSTGPSTSTATGAMTPLNAGDRKLVRRLLRLALDGPLRMQVTGQATGQAARQVTGQARPVVEAGGRTITDVDPALLRRLVADGLLVAVPKGPAEGRAEDHAEGYAATAETASWLRRALTDAAAEPFLDQHRVLETVTLKEPDGCRNVRRNLAEQPLFPLLRLKDRQGLPFLPEDAVRAGERLAEDFERGGLQPRITASWEPRLSSRARGQAPAAADLSDMAQSARRRLGAAVTAMGPELSGVALDVCCFGKGLETVERERQWPARSAKLMLRTALLALARHYAPPQRQHAQHRPRHWGEDGYRPEIS